MKTQLFSFTTPNTPPTTEENALAALRLIRSRRVGATTYHRLICEHGSAAAALEALPRVAAEAGVRDYAPCPEGVAQAELRAGRKAGARLLVHGAPDYPADLAQIADAPPVLWAMGDVALMARPMVALIGARNASSLGLRMARKLAEGLTGAGFVVVAGLARGIDAAAHEAALAGGTIAVQAGGIDMIYPAENRDLAQAIARQGLRLCEGPPGTEPQARHFPQRNRIVAGLSRAVIVVEAAHRSGSLITARMALDQGRELLAVPGHPFDARAAGANALIRDGATLVRGVRDVLNALGIDADSMPAATEPPPRPAAAPPRPGLAQRMHQVLGRPSASAHATAARLIPAPAPQGHALHQHILSRLGPSPLPEDELLRDLALNPQQVSPALLDLEMAGEIERHPGGLLSRRN